MVPVDGGLRFDATAAAGRRHPVGDLNLGGNDIYSASTITATGDIAAARYQ